MIFLVGDVHGCFQELELLLKKSCFQPEKHRLILLGDLINKGPRSFEVLKWVKNQQNKNQAVQTLLGNHELKFIRMLEKNEVPLPEQLQELKTQMGRNLPEWLKWLKSWPVYIEEKDFLAVHGGVIPGEHPRFSKPQWLTNIRHWDGQGLNLNNPSDPPWHHLYTGKKLVVYAHWARQGLCVKHNSIGLDTGCVYGGHLTGVWLPSKKIVQVPSLQPQSYFEKSH